MLGSNNPMPNILGMAKDIMDEMNIDKNTELNEEKIKDIFSHVSSSVSKLMSPALLGGLNIDYNNSNNDYDCDDNSVLFELPISLKYLYSGKTKKISVKRHRYMEDDENEPPMIEKHTIKVNILPGMCIGEEIVFRNEGDEVTPGVFKDVIIRLIENDEDEKFIRMENKDDLALNMDISYSECYHMDFSLDHISGEKINIRRDGENILSGDKCLRIPGRGMPKSSGSGFGDLYIYFSLVHLPMLNSEDVKKISNYLPPIMESPIEDKEYDDAEDFILDDKDCDSNSESSHCTH